jgi:hypothetical protein
VFEVEIIVCAGVEVVPFGSFESNFYTAWGDLDLSLEFPVDQEVSPTFTKSKKVKVLRSIERVLARSGISSYAPVFKKNILWNSSLISSFIWGVLLLTWAYLFVCNRSPKYLLLPPLLKVLQFKIIVVKEVLGIKYFSNETNSLMTMHRSCLEVAIDCACPCATAYVR